MATAQSNGNGFGSVSKSNEQLGSYGSKSKDAVYVTGSYRNYGKGSVGVSNNTNGNSGNQVAFSDATMIINNVNLFKCICAIMFIKFLPYNALN